MLEERVDSVRWVAGLLRCQRSPRPYEAVGSVDIGRRPELPVHPKADLVGGGFRRDPSLGGAGFGRGADAAAAVGWLLSASMKLARLAAAPSAAGRRHPGGGAGRA